MSSVTERWIATNESEWESAPSITAETIREAFDEIYRRANNPTPIEIEQDRQRRRVQYEQMAYYQQLMEGINPCKKEEKRKPLTSILDLL